MRVEFGGRNIVIERFVIEIEKRGMGEIMVVRSGLIDFGRRVNEMEIGIEVIGELFMIGIMGGWRVVIRVDLGVCRGMVGVSDIVWKFCEDIFIMWREW